MSEDLVKKHGLERFGWQEIQNGEDLYRDVLIACKDSNLYRYDIARFDAQVKAVLYNRTIGNATHYKKLPITPTQPDPVLTALAIAMDALENIRQVGNTDVACELAAYELEKIKQILEKGIK